MKVTVSLFGTLRQFLPAGSGFNSCELSLPAITTLDQVLQTLQLADAGEFIILLNDTKINPELYAETLVRDSDEVVLLPPIKGG